MNFKNNIILLLLTSIILPFSLSASLSEEELKPFEKVLPKGTTIKNIAEWPLEITYRKLTLKLDVNTYTFQLRSKDRSKLEKKGKVRFRIAGDVEERQEGKRTKRNYKGSVNIYMISTGGNPRVVDHKRVKLSKLCPS